MLESRTEVWREVGLGAELDRQQVHQAQGGLVVVLVLIAGVLIASTIATRSSRVSGRRSRVQATLDEEVSVPMRYPPQISVEELDRDDVVVRIVATPMKPADGARLADVVLAAARPDGDYPDGDG